MEKIRVYIAGHNGMVGSAILRKLKKLSNVEVVIKDRNELNLLDYTAVKNFFDREKIDQIYLAAAKVGGIQANNEFPADFIYENITIQNNIVHCAHLSDVNDILFLGSSCIYPKFSEQPIQEESLLTGKLERTNEPYAIAKIAGIKLCESYNRQYGRNYRSVMPTNLYGPNDNFHPDNSHVIPALLRRFHEAKLEGAKEVVVWGSGTPMREFLYVDDMADACIHIMNMKEDLYSSHTEAMLSHINVGTGIDCTIKELVNNVSSVVGFKGKIKFDKSKPDGTPRKLLDVSKLNAMGWKYSIDLNEGLKKSYEWFVTNQSQYRQ